MKNTKIVKSPCTAICKQKGSETKMTLNILFLTITIRKRKISTEEAVHQEMVEKLYEQYKDRQISMYRNI